MMFWLLITSILLQSLQALPQQQAEHEELTETQKFIEYIMKMANDLAIHAVREAEVVFDKVIDELDTKYADNAAVQERVSKLKSFSDKVKTSNKQDITMPLKLYNEYDFLSRKLNVTRFENPSEAEHIVYDSLKANNWEQVQVNFEKESRDIWEDFTEKFPKYVDGQPEDRKVSLNNWYTNVLKLPKIELKVVRMISLPYSLDPQFAKRYDIF